MKYDVKIDDKLYEIYSDIRLGLLQFKAEVKEWNDIPGVRGSHAAYKAFGRYLWQFYV